VYKIENEIKLKTKKLLIISLILSYPAVIVFSYSFHKNVAMRKIKNIKILFYGIIILWFYKENESVHYN